jgi:hypothetical protein
MGKRERERECVCVCVPELYGTANISAKGVVPSVSQAPQRYSLTGVCVCVCGGGGERRERNKQGREGAVEEGVYVVCVGGGGNMESGHAQRIGGYRAARPEFGHEVHAT